MQNDPNVNATSVRTESALATNKVLRNTYMLLSLTLIFSALTAGFAMITNAPPLNIWLVLAGFLGLPILVQVTRKSSLGLVSTFLFTGFVGYATGPILNAYLTTFSNGAELITMALGSTGLIFLGLSAIAMNPSRDFSHWGRFLTVGIAVAFIAMIANVFFFKLPGMYLAVSVLFSLISGGLILFQTNMIIKGGETNYISATLTLYISIYNIFMTLLQIFGLGGNRN